MTNLKFYYVDNHYIQYLQNYEINHRGFTRVPNMDYQDHNQKFVVGKVYNINGFNYYAPITHYKQPKPNNLLIVINKDTHNKIKGSIRFNYMFPIPSNSLLLVDFNNILDAKQKRLLQKEYQFCIRNSNIINNLALNTYNQVVTNCNKDMIKNYCDFTLLEKACKVYDPTLINTPTFN